MASKKKAKKVAKKKKATKKTAKKATRVKRDPVADFRQRLAAKGRMVGVPFSSDEVIAHPRYIIPTGITDFDHATGIGGLPSGRMIEVYGKPQTGKTTFVDIVTSSVQRLGGVAAAIDVEERKDRNYSRVLGVDTDALTMLEPPADPSKDQPQWKTLEAVVEAISDFLDVLLDMKLEAPSLISWDSVGATANLKEFEDPTDSQPGVSSKHIRRALRGIIPKAARANALILVTNHTYENFAKFGQKTSTSGGGGIRYQASNRIELRYVKKLEGASSARVGFVGNLQMVKASHGAPFEIPYAIEWGKGFSNAWSMFEALRAPTIGYIKQSASWSTYSSAERTVRFQGGFRGFGELLNQDPALLSEATAIHKAILEQRK